VSKDKGFSDQEKSSRPKRKTCFGAPEGVERRPQFRQEYPTPAGGGGRGATADFLVERENKRFFNLLGWD